MLGGWATLAHAQTQTPIPAQVQTQLSTVDASAPATAKTPAVVFEARSRERAQLQQQRQAIDEALQQGQAACYQRFAVEDCLQRERRRARQATAPLVQREAALNEAERRERASQRLNDIAERKTPEKPEIPASSASVRNTDASVDVLQQERAFEAQQRAQRLQQKQQQHEAGMAGQVSQRAAAAEKARQRLEEKQQAAERRRARALQAQQDRAAAGRKPPAALDRLP